MVSEGRGRLFRRKDGKYLIYVPKDLAEDSMFPFRDSSSVHVKITFKIGRDKLLLSNGQKKSRVLCTRTPRRTCEPFFGSPIDSEASSNLAHAFLLQLGFCLIG